MSSAAASLYHSAFHYYHNRQPQTAISILNHLLNKNPHHPPTYYLLGLCFQQQNQHPQAIESFHQALQLKPTFYQAQTYLALSYLDTNQLPTAITLLQQALSYRPDFTPALKHLTSLFNSIHQPTLSSAYLHLFQLSPTPFPNLAHLTRSPDPLLSQTLCHLYDLALQTLNFPAQQKLLPLLSQLTRHQITSHLPIQETPYKNLLRTQNQSTNLAVASSHSKSHLSPISIPFTHPPSTPSHPLRIGYLSADFLDNVIGHQLAPLFGLHHRPQFHISCYSLSPSDGSSFAQTIQSSSDQFHQIAHLSPSKAAHLIHTHHIDILVDLTGHTQGHHLQIPAHRPAPIQIHYLGFPGSTGANYIDYLITDPTIIPPQSRRYYTENLISLPHSYQFNHPHSLPSSPPSHPELLPTNAQFVFACFHPPFKLTLPLLQIWLQLLHQLPHSILWLPRYSKLTSHRLTQLVQSHHLSPSRLLFAPQLPLSDHLHRLSLAQLTLDPFSYSGGATTANSLEAGVPVLTLTGGHHASRMSTSLLLAIGLPELITSSSADYLHLALHLATHPQKLLALRHTLLAHKHNFPLFHASRFIKNLEAAYLNAWNRYQTGQPPTSFQTKDPLPLYS